MATQNLFAKQNGQFTRVLPPTLTQGQNFYNTNTGANEGIVNFSTETGQRLLPGQTTPLQPARTLNTPIPSPYTPPQAPQSPTPQETTKTDPYTAFNLLLQNALKKAQGLDNTENLKQQRTLSREAISRGRGGGIDEPTSEELKFLSPSQQASMRGADVNALSSDIDEVQYAITQNNQNRQNLLEQIQMAQSMGNQAREQELKAKAFDADEAFRQAQLSEQIRSNKASERIAGQKAVSSLGEYNLSSKQQTLLNGVIGKYTADNVIKQGQSAVQINNIIKAINANPTSAGNQLIALYTLVKNLDPDSAVREGELDLASKTNSYLGKFQDAFARVSSGRVLNPDAVKELTSATKTLADEWVKSSQRRQKQYSSQAGVFGLEQPFADYIGGFENPDVIFENQQNLGAEDFNYERDYAYAKDAVSRGADPNAVRAEMLKKYKDVDPL